MQTNIDIDDRLMQQAMRCSGTHTKKAAVEAGLHLLVETHGQRGIARLRGKLELHGNRQSHLRRDRKLEGRHS